MISKMNTNLYHQFIEYALLEDMPYDDITTSNLITENSTDIAYIICKENCILCGIDLVKEIFSRLDKTIEFEKLFKDGDKVQKDDKICKIYGNTRAILKGERISLNLISYLTGIATQTSAYVDIISEYGVKLLDTRKTLPLYRSMVKYAVVTGGGSNHRFNLSDMIMIKDNHIKVIGGISVALDNIKDLKNKYPFTKIEVEVKNIKEAMTALKYSPDIIMLDNFSVSDCSEAISYLKGKVEIEISGGINLSTISEYAKLKPDYISVGSITHSVKAIDFSLEID
jgi:nicotinate-nucleotide pyrophosphorylase (carboxylating)